jgi:hypothetical protein
MDTGKYYCSYYLYCTLKIPFLGGFRGYFEFMRSCLRIIIFLYYFFVPCAVYWRFSAAGVCYWFSGLLFTLYR